MLDISSVYLLADNKISFSIRNVIDSFTDSIALGIFEILKKY